MFHFQVAHQKTKFACELTSVVPCQLSSTAGVQQIDRAWHELNNCIPTHLPRRVKAKGSYVHNPAIERRVWQFVWRRELKESAPEDVLEALMRVIQDSGR